MTSSPQDDLSCVIFDTLDNPQAQAGHNSLLHIPEGLNIVNFWGNAKSAVWKYFGFLADDSGVIIERNRAVCRVCRCAIRFSGNTTNLGNHMHKHHPDLECTLDSKVPAHSANNGPPRMRHGLSSQRPPQIHEIRPIQIEDSSMSRMDGTMACRYQNQRGLQLTNYTQQLLKDWLVKDLIPIETIQGTEFMRFVSVLDTKFQCPPLSYFRDVLLMPAYADLKTELKLKVSAAEHICLRPERWIGVNNEIYISYYSTYMLQGTYVRQSSLLWTTSIQAPLTTRKLTISLQKVMSDWSLNDSLVVVSNDAKITKAVEVLSTISIVPCITDTINQAVQGCYLMNEEMRTTRDICWDIMQIMKSDTAVAMEHDLRAKFDCNTSLTRPATWVLTHDVMVWITEHVEIVNGVLGTQTVVQDLELTEDMRTTINQITGSLSQLRLAVTMLIEQDPPPLSVILPLLQRLYNNKLQVTDNDEELTTIIKTSVMEKLKSLYDEDRVMELLKVATVLDPRFKAVQFLRKPHNAYELVKKLALTLHKSMNSSPEEENTNLLPDLSTDFKVVIKEEPNEDPSITVSLEEPPTKYPRLEGTNSRGSTPGRHENTVSTSSSVSNNSAMSIFFDEEAGGEVTESPEKMVESEFIRYLNEEKVPMSASPYEWWLKNGNKYPLLSILAATHLCIPASAISPSRIYVNNSTEDSFTRKRLGLAPTNVDLQLFLYTNHR